MSFSLLIPTFHRPARLARCLHHLTLQFEAALFESLKLEIIIADGFENPELNILKDENVKAILINIFGGIVRCDRVAQGVVDAYKSFGSFPVPLIVRLQGTNAVEAKQLIDDSGLDVHSVVLLQDAADKVKEVLA